MDEFAFTIILILVEIIFSIGVLVALRKAGANRLMLVVVAGIFLLWLISAYCMVTRGFFSATGIAQLAFGSAVTTPVLIGLLAQKFCKSFAAVVKNMRTESLLSLQQMRSAFGVLFFFTSSLPVWFQYIGGLGDIAAGLGAFYALKEFSNNPDKERQAIVKGNLIGILDFIIVLTLGVFVLLRARSPDMIFDLIPLYVVPIFILLHIFSLQKLSDHNDLN